MPWREPLEEEKWSAFSESFISGHYKSGTANQGTSARFLKSIYSFCAYRYSYLYICVEGDKFCFYFFALN